MACSACQKLSADEQNETTLRRIVAGAKFEMFRVIILDEQLYPLVSSYAIFILPFGFVWAVLPSL